MAGSKEGGKVPATPHDTTNPPSTSTIQSISSLPSPSPSPISRYHYHRRAQPIIIIISLSFYYPTMASNQPASKRARTEDDIVVGVGDDNVVDSTKPEPLTATTTTEVVDVDISNTHNSNHILEPIQPNVLLQSDEYAKLYSEAKPFSHGIIHNFCREGFLGELFIYCASSSSSTTAATRMMIKSTQKL